MKKKTKPLDVTYLSYLSQNPKYGLEYLEKNNLKLKEPSYGANILNSLFIKMLKNKKKKLSEEDIITAAMLFDDITPNKKLITQLKELMATIEEVLYVGKILCEFETGEQFLIPHIIICKENNFLTLVYIKSYFTDQYIKPEVLATLITQKYSMVTKVILAQEYSSFEPDNNEKYLSALSLNFNHTLYATYLKQLTYLYKLYKEKIRLNPNCFTEQARDIF